MEELYKGMSRSAYHKCGDFFYFCMLSGDSLGNNTQLLKIETDSEKI